MSFAVILDVATRKALPSVRDMPRNLVIIKGDARQLGDVHCDKRPQQGRSSRFSEIAQPNESSSLFSARQITRHSRLESARSKESVKELGRPTEDAIFMQEPTFVKLTTVQAQREELLFKMIFAFFNTRVR
jgi:hypothetical protein